MRLFRSAAFYNITLALVNFLSLRTHLEVFYDYQHDDIHHVLSMYHYNFWVLILLMGIGCFLVSINPDRNKGLVVITMLGKLFTVAFWAYSFFTENGTAMLMVNIALELIFVILFIRFLYEKGLV